MTFLKRVSNFFSTEMKAQRDKCGGRILLGYNTDGGAVMLRTIRFTCFGVWDSTGLHRLYSDTSANEDNSLRNHIR